MELSLEVDDWDDGNSSGSPRVKSEKNWHVILDFDKTITVDDTIEPLMKTAIRLNANSEVGKSTFGEDAEAKLLGDWEEVKKRYAGDLKAYEEGAKYRLADVSDETSYLQTEIEVVEYLRPLEEMSLARVVKTQILETVDGKELQNAARSATSVAGVSTETNGMITPPCQEDCSDVRVTVRSDFRKFAEEIDSRALSKWGVISVNWSKDWIRGVLGKALERDDESMSRIHIIANDLVDETFISKYVENGYMENEECKLILSSEDKVHHLRPLASKFNSEAQCSPRPPIIYIGDSVTDLYCLLMADVGIILLPPSTVDPSTNPLVTIVRSCEFAVAPVSAYKTLYQREGTKTKEEADPESMELEVAEADDDIDMLAVDDEEPVLGPFVRLLMANSFEEILECGLLDDQPSYARNCMVRELHKRNMVGNRPI